ncbi:O-antigen ligase family protein [bacterium]|nr:O-antigen ligase family protein [bacterium]
MGVIAPLTRRPAVLALTLTALSAALAAAALLVEPIFVLAGAIALVGAAALISYPFACVPIYYVLIYVRPGDTWEQLEKLRIVLLLVALMGGAFVLRVLVFRNLKLLRSGQLAAVIALMAVIGMSIIGSYYRSASLERFFDMARVLVMVFLVAHIVDTLPRLKITIWSILLSLTYLAVTNFTLWATGQKVIDNGGSGGVSGGFLGDGNDFALAMNVMMPMAIFQFLYAKTWKLRLACAGVVVAFVLAIVATYSRGGFLGLIAVFAMAFFFYIMRTRQWGKGVAIIVLVFLLGGIGIAIFAPDSFKERMGGMAEYEEDESALGRLDAWGAGVRMLVDQPLFGVGAGAFSDAYGLKYKPFDAIANTWREAHSFYVQTMAELGIAGIFCVGFLIFLEFRDQRRIHQYGIADPRIQKEVHFLADALTCGLVGFLVSGAFLSVLYYPHLYILATLTIILLNIARKTSQFTPEEFVREAHVSQI